MMLEIKIERVEGQWLMDRIGLEDIPGVYFIYNINREVIYIGQTKKLLTRTVQHFSSDVWFKLFAKYISFQKTNINNLRTEEARLIEAIRPKYNFEHFSLISDGEMRDAIREKPIL